MLEPGTVVQLSYRALDDTVTEKAVEVVAYDGATLGYKDVGEETVYFLPLSRCLLMKTLEERPDPQAFGQ